MPETIRDHVRLRMPRALNFYQRHVAPRLGGDSRHIELSDWVSEGNDLVGRTGMHGIRFERDGTWIDDGDGYLWSYTPGLFGSALGAEFGIRYEEEEIDLLADRLRGGGVLVDVGANIGLHSIKLARRIPELRVLAFEPVGHTYETLLRNAEKNGVAAQIDAQHLALAEEDGELRLTTRFAAGNFVVPDGTRAADGVTETVACRRLDDVLEGRTDRIDAIKCDVEGAELSVLRGATATIERHKPLLLLEADERWAQRYGHSATAVFEFLQARGYGYERIVDGALLPASGSLAADLEAGRNFLFTAA